MVLLFAPIIEICDLANFSPNFSSFLSDDFSDEIIFLFFRTIVKLWLLIGHLYIKILDSSWRFRFDSTTTRRTVGEEGRGLKRSTPTTTAATGVGGVLFLRKAI